MSEARQKKPRLRLPVYLTESAYFALTEAADTTGQTLSQFAVTAIAKEVERVARLRLRAARARTRRTRQERNAPAPGETR